MQHETAASEGREDSRRRLRRGMMGQGGELLMCPPPRLCRILLSPHRVAPLRRTRARVAPWPRPRDICVGAPLASDRSRLGPIRSIAQHRCEGQAASTQRGSLVFSARVGPTAVILRGACFGADSCGDLIAAGLAGYGIAVDHGVAAGHPRQSGAGHGAVAGHGIGAGHWDRHGPWLRRRAVGRPQAMGRPQAV